MRARPLFLQLNQSDIQKAVLVKELLEQVRHTAHRLDGILIYVAELLNDPQIVTQLRFRPCFAFILDKCTDRFFGKLA
jgi:hypothetical protein